MSPITQRPLTDNDRLKFIAACCSVWYRGAQILSAEQLDEAIRKALSGLDSSSDEPPSRRIDDRRKD